MADPCDSPYVLDINIGESLFGLYCYGCYFINSWVDLKKVPFMEVLSFTLLIGSALILFQAYYGNLSAMNPRDILNCINRGEGKWEEFSKLPEIEKLEKAYSLASGRAYEAFKAFLIGWIIVGVGNAALWYAIMEGALPYDSTITKLAVVSGPLLGLCPLRAHDIHILKAQRI
ncbi:hypothetical protein X802_05175 [Thermococcus guaymasensis DSM 11113]|uniref:Uncharacterized protein n=2 Tax=Thermococcus guaymasensis TaxID=110164 RepID=A0A0X1KN59_9EURY|nr:hypothetical protein X802_05175 [Thermococcus guaymasensis DSM 11113]